MVGVAAGLIVSKNKTGNVRKPNDNVEHFKIEQNKLATMPIMAENRTEHCKVAKERIQHDTLIEKGEEVYEEK